MGVKKSKGFDFVFLSCQNYFLSFVRIEQLQKCRKRSSKYAVCDLQSTIGRFFKQIVKTSGGQIPCLHSLRNQQFQLSNSTSLNRILESNQQTTGNPQPPRDTAQPIRRVVAVWFYI